MQPATLTTMDLSTPRYHNNLIRRDACLAAAASDNPSHHHDSYNTGIHVAALFVLFAVSGSAAAFPQVAARCPSLRIPRRFFFVVRHFGTGVLMATTFAHLLPTAFGNLLDPCMGPFWTETYPAMAGTVVMAAIFFVAGVKMSLHSVGKASHDVPSFVAGSPGSGHQDSTRGPIRDTESLGSSAPVAPNAAPKPPQQHHHRSRRVSITESDRSYKGSAAKSNQAQVLLLEAGIIFHSVFIGLALSVTKGATFITFFVAIIFHQSFEGLALGSRIADVAWGSERQWQPWVMALAYGLTTPLGQAIGIATHTLYSPDSSFGHTIVGVCNAVSAGFLTYASLVEFLYEDFLCIESWERLRGVERVAACMIVLLGAFLMSLIAAWV